ncbi:MAG TPA: potassium channel protein [Pyrinomonadaceae bacterium]|jgi:voltage-gated potassium channel|nr:potassium channel protein [Pyrinomonadaceae bacterium]
MSTSQSLSIHSFFPRQKLVYALVAVLITIIFGAVGFHLIEGFSWGDSFYVAVQTVTTVGYGDITPVTPAGRLFATIFILFGAGTALYALTAVAQAVFQSEVMYALGVRMRRREMDNLQNHRIVCGAGRVGRRIISQLKRQHIPFVVIEKNRDRVAAMIENGDLVIVGDATLESNLQKAGVERAVGLASCLPDDADNVYVVLTARGMNEKLHIVARAVEEEAESKLIRAGANRVIAPIVIGGRSMAAALLKPALADFMDSIVAEDMGLIFEQVEISAGSSLVDKRLKDVDLRVEVDVLIVAIRRENSEMIFHPSGETVLLEGDLLIVIGKLEAMKKLVEVCG